jgi:hypothetical protein
MSLSGKSHKTVQCDAFDILLELERRQSLGKSSGQLKAKKILPSKSSPCIL